MKVEGGRWKVKAENSVDPFMRRVNNSKSGLLVGANLIRGNGQMSDIMLQYQRSINTSLSILKASVTESRHIQPNANTLLLKTPMSMQTS